MFSLLGVFERAKNQNRYPHPLHKLNLQQIKYVFLRNFRHLNNQLKRKPYPMPNINEMFLKLECFQYGTSIDLNTGYYHILMIKNASNLCKIILPWRQYRYKSLPTRLANSPDIFQHKMSDIFYEF